VSVLGGADEAMPERSCHTRSVSMMLERGLEPISRPLFMFSLLLIIAFLCANLHAVIQRIPSKNKVYLASSCNDEQKKLCGIVRLCGNCAVVKDRLIMCGIVREGFHRYGLNRHTTPTACAHFSRNRAALFGNRRRHCAG